MQGALLLLLLAPSDVAGDSMRSAVIARYGRHGLNFSPGPTATLMPRFVYLRDTGLELPLPPWQTEAAYAEAFEIARRGFHSTQPDRARAIMVITSFDEGGDNLFYVPLANDVVGLGETSGAQIFDDTPDSAIDGYVWMGSLDRLEEAGDAYFREAFLHEIAHRWGAYAAVAHSELAQGALRGRQSTHWSFFVDRQKSPMDGNDWTASGANMIAGFSDPPEFAFSSLDMYLMGVLPPEQVPAFDVITSFSNVSPPWLLPMPETAPAHRLGAEVTLFDARTVSVTIDDIIAASGERTPPAEDRTVTWPIGIVFLSNGFATPTLSDFALLDRRIAALTDEFAIATEGRMLLDVHIDGAGDRPPGSSCGSVDECDMTLSDVCMAPASGAEAICTRTCQTQAVCGPSQCCTDGICVPSAYCGGIDRPVDDAGTAPIGPTPEHGDLVLDGGRGCNCTALRTTGPEVWLALAALSRAIRVRRRLRR